ncbi:zinc finger protein ZFMSA12A-like [Hylaeus anthracinus]|uniref:zinc finger protein ZFMSA12A-like n=1 Tax=Hylaeus anthracinus TaxID=313031 RepID=UPI0023BA31D8|nr:zinc finger protein ZFMSA12A-like [Hylaeus anthracinus]
MERRVLLIVTHSNNFTTCDQEDFNQLSQWFVKQEVKYELPQSLYQYVASNYSPKSEERRKSSKSVVCEECGKSFSRPDSLRRHEKSYCKVKGDRMYCRFCGKKFAKLAFLNDHVKSVHSILFSESDTQ